MTFGQILQRILDRHNLTQAQAAEQIGTSRYTISQLVNDRRVLTPSVALGFERAGLAQARKLLLLQLDRDLDTARKELGT